VLLRQALRRLIAAPLFTVFAIVSLAAGVAITTAVYSVVDALLFADLGIDDPGRVVSIATLSNGRSREAAITEPDLEHLRAATTSLASVAASVVVFLPVTSSANAEVTPTEAVDGSYFKTFGIGAGIGRVIDDRDHRSAARVAVLSDEFWKRRFAGDRAIAGRTIRIAGQTFEVIGVARAKFLGPFARPRVTNVWIPIGTEAGMTANAVSSAEREQRRMTVFGRLAPGATVAMASAELATAAQRLDRELPVAGSRDPLQATTRAWAVKAIAGPSDDDGWTRRVGLTIVILIAMVLVAACTNLANLVLARGAARQGELAVRMAMGASRARLVWEQCVESAILALLGAIASYLMFVVISAWMTQDFAIVAPPMGRMTLPIRPVLNAQALGVAAMSMLLALAVFGLEPAIQLARNLDIRGALAAGATGVRPRARRQRMVIRWQVAIAAGFFILATMFIKATIEQARHDTGVELDRIAVATLDFQSGVWDEARMRHVVGRVLEEARQDAGVAAVAASTGLPFGIQPAMQVGITLPGADSSAELNRAASAAIAVSPAFFQTTGVRIVEGRAFTDDDRQGGAPVMIVSQLLARQLFGSGSAVGREVIFKRQQDARTATIVGVAHDTDVRMIYSRPQPLAYLPLDQHFNRFLAVTARSAAGGANAVAPLREAIRRADLDLGVDIVGAGRPTLSGPFEVMRSAGRGTLYLGGFTLLLSMVGLFGVQSHAVAYRTREIGVRMSMGASAAQIKMMVMKDGYRPVLEGLALGLWGGLAGRAMVRASVDVDVAIVDVWMIVITPIPLVLAAFCACYLPAARAARVNPTVAMRCE
jgi:predicted permease